MGSKEGITEGITALVGSDITDAVLRLADGTNFKSIDEYSLAKLFAAALEGANRPESTKILDQLVEAITFPFDSERSAAPTLRSSDRRPQKCHC